jgi:hypothetical protein
MFTLIVSSMIAVQPPYPPTESINKFCAYVTGIPYASDNFTNEEWERFSFCRENIKIK